MYFLLSERCDECERIRDGEMVSHLLAVFHVWSPISSSTHLFRRPCIYTSDIFPYRYWHPEPQQLLRGHEHVPRAKSPSKSPMRKKTKGVSRFLSTPVSDGCVRNPTQKLRIANIGALQGVPPNDFESHHLLLG